MLHERRDWRGLTPYAPYGSVVTPGIVSGAVCALGSTFFYDPGTPGVPSSYYVLGANNGGMIVDSNGYLKMAPQVRGNTTYSMTFTTPAVTAFDIRIAYSCRITTAGTNNGTTSFLQAFQVGSDINITFNQVIAGSDNYTLSMVVKDGASTTLSTTVVATGNPRPFNITTTGIIRVVRVDGATTVYTVYLDGVLIVTFDCLVLRGALVITHKVQRQAPVVATNYWESEFMLKQPYYIGSGLPNTCGGT